MRFQYYLKDKDVLSDEKIDALEEEIKQEIHDAVKNYEDKAKEFKDPLNMFDHIFDELPAYTQEQKKELREELKENKEKDSSRESEEDGQDDDGSSA
jgi:pyruvate dehydrogenase E1 component alpha subunit